MDRSELDPEVAERLRTALIACAEAAYEDARLRGLCSEGAWEAAITALRAAPLDAVIAAEGAPPR